MNQPTRRFQQFLTIAFAVSSAMPVLPLFAQPKPAVRATPQTVGKIPLDSLDDSQLMSELANRGDPPELARPGRHRRATARDG